MNKEKKMPIDLMTTRLIFSLETYVSVVLLRSLGTLPISSSSISQTYLLYSLANFRWRAVQSISDFHETAGVYRDTELDDELLTLARKVAEAIGHGADPAATRTALRHVGLQVFACGKGGHLVCRKPSNMYSDKTVVLQLTP